MLNLIKILLFSQTITLTPLPILLKQGESHEIKLTNSISAITSGAHIRIDISAMKPDDANDFSSIKSWVEKSFKEYDIIAEISNTESGDNINIFYLGGFSWNGEKVHLKLNPTTGFPINANYNKLIVSSNVELKNVYLLWQNYSL